MPYPLTITKKVSVGGLGTSIAFSKLQQSRAVMGKAVPDGVGKVDYQSGWSQALAIKLLTAIWRIDVDHCIVGA